MFSAPAPKPPADVAVSQSLEENEYRSAFSSARKAADSNDSIDWEQHNGTPAREEQNGEVLAEQRVDSARSSPRSSRSQRENAASPHERFGSPHPSHKSTTSQHDSPAHSRRSSYHSTKSNHDESETLLLQKNILKPVARSLILDHTHENGQDTVNEPISKSLDMTPSQFRTVSPLISARSTLNGQSDAVLAARVVEQSSMPQHGAGSRRGSNEGILLECEPHVIKYMTIVCSKDLGQVERDYDVKLKAHESVMEITSVDDTDLTAELARDKLNEFCKRTAEEVVTETIELPSNEGDTEWPQGILNQVWQLARTSGQVEISRFVKKKQLLHLNLYQTEFDQNTFVN